MNRKLFVILSLALVLLVSSAAMAQPIRAVGSFRFLGDQSFNDSAYQGLRAIRFRH